MLAHGWLDEVRTLMDSGLTDQAKPFDFIGYRELRAVARGEMQLADAKAAIQQIDPPLCEAPDHVVS